MSDRGRGENPKRRGETKAESKRTREDDKEPQSSRCIYPSTLTHLAASRLPQEPSRRVVIADRRPKPLHHADSSDRSSSQTHPSPAASIPSAWAAGNATTRTADETVPDYSSSTSSAMGGGKEMGSRVCSRQEEVGEEEVTLGGVRWHRQRLGLPPMLQGSTTKGTKERFRALLSASQTGHSQPRVEPEDFKPISKVHGE